MGMGSYRFAMSSWRLGDFGRWQVLVGDQWLYSFWSQHVAEHVAEHASQAPAPRRDVRARIRREIVEALSSAGPYGESRVWITAHVTGHYDTIRQEIKSLAESGALTEVRVGKAWLYELP
jgi:hypothetical protein